MQEKELARGRALSSCPAQRRCRARVTLFPPDPRDLFLVSPAVPEALLPGGSLVQSRRRSLPGAAPGPLHPIGNLSFKSHGEGVPRDGTPLSGVTLGW